MQGWPQVGLELAVELCMPGTGVPSSESKRPGHGVWDTALRQYCEARLAGVQREAQVTWRQGLRSLRSGLILFVVELLL